MLAFAPRRHRPPAPSLSAYRAEWKKRAEPTVSCLCPQVEKDNSKRPRSFGSRRLHQVERSSPGSGCGPLPDLFGCPRSALWASNQTGGGAAGRLTFDLAGGFAKAMAQNFDVVVVGGGLVGASTAFHLAARSNLTVARWSSAAASAVAARRRRARYRAHPLLRAGQRCPHRGESRDISTISRPILTTPWAESGASCAPAISSSRPKDRRATSWSRTCGCSGSSRRPAPISHAEALELHPLLDLTGIGGGRLRAALGLRRSLPHDERVRAGRAPARRDRDDRPPGRAASHRGDAGHRRRDDAGRDTCRMRGLRNRTVGRARSPTPSVLRGTSRSRATRFLRWAPAPRTGRMMPVIKDLSTGNKMYFRPSTGGVVLVGTGDYGDPLVDPDTMSAEIEDDFVLLQGGQSRAAHAELLRCRTG